MNGRAKSNQQMSVRVCERVCVCVYICDMVTSPARSSTEHLIIIHKSVSLVRDVYSERASSL